MRPALGRFKDSGARDGLRLESAATALYLLTPTQRDERVSRRLALEHSSQLDRKAIASTLGVPNEPPFDDNMRRLRQVAERRPSVDVAALFSRPPGYARIVRLGGDKSALGGPLVEALWRRCSGMAHGKAWALLGVLDRDEVRRASEGVLHARLTASASDVAMTTHAAVMLTEEARQLLTRQAARWYAAGDSDQGPSGHYKAMTAALPSVY